MKEKVKRELENYKDIVHLPHYVSSQRAKMTIADRAAQFAPFAAVVGHESAVKEAARITVEKKELDEMEKAIIDFQLREIEAQFPNPLEVSIVYFKPDGLKSGGRYVTGVGKVKQIDLYERTVVMVEGLRISIDEIYSIGK